MALADVKVYFKQVEDQWFEAKADLADFEQALKDKHITEDQLADVEENFAILDENYQRLAYIMHLFAIPNRHSRKLTQADLKLADKFSLVGADEDYVLKENEDALKNLRAEITRLKEHD